MENSVKPDRKFFKKVLWIQLTLTISVLLIMSVVHFLVTVFNGELQVVYGFWLASVIAIILMWIISTIIAHLWIKNLEYLIADDTIKIHKGIITKTQQNIPFRMVTDFALERTLFDRILGIGAIKIQTAGQSHTPTGYEGKLSGLIAYEDLHADLRAKIKSLHPVSGPVTPAQVSASREAELLEQIRKELSEIKEVLSKK